MSIREHLAAWVAAVVFFVIGAVWYGQFQTAWLAGIGKTLAGGIIGGWKRAPA